MSEPGKAMMGTAIAGGPDRANKAAEAAVACPLLEGIDLSGARGVLVLIAANRNTFKLSESRNAMNTHPPLRRRRRARHLRHRLRRGARRPAARHRDRHRPEPGRARPQTPMQVVHSAPMQRTGTDNLPVLNQQVQMPAARSTTTTRGLTTPSVWRNGRTAAAKVDALASNGMDEIEIPAFLRKQAD